MKSQVLFKKYLKTIKMVLKYLPKCVNYNKQNQTLSCGAQSLESTTENTYFIYLVY